MRKSFFSLAKKGSGNRLHSLTWGENPRRAELGRWHMSLGSIRNWNDEIGNTQIMLRGFFDQWAFPFISLIGPLHPPSLKGCPNFSNRLVDVQQEGQSRNNSFPITDVKLFPHRWVLMNLALTNSWAFSEHMKIYISRAEGQNFGYCHSESSDWTVTTLILPPFFFLPATDQMYIYWFLVIQQKSVLLKLFSLQQKLVSWVPS